MKMIRPVVVKLERAVCRGLEGTGPVKWEIVPGIYDTGDVEDAVKGEGGYTSGAGPEELMYVSHELNGRRRVWTNIDGRAREMSPALADWETREDVAEMMSSASEYLDRETVMRASCAVVNSVLPLTTERSAYESVSAARAWLRGKASEIGVQAATEAAWEKGRDLGGTVAGSVCFAAARCSYMALGTTWKDDGRKAMQHAEKAIVRATGVEQNGFPGLAKALRTVITFDRLWYEKRQQMVKEQRDLLGRKLKELARV
jgi:hypothetical protein